MPWATATDGTRIFYRAAGTGPPLLISNASFSTHRHWLAQQERLSKRLRVVLWDYRGHGRSDAPDDPSRYSLEQVLEDLRAVHREAAGGGPVLLGGLSMGGLLSISYALAWPTEVRALLLFNTGPGFKNPEAAAQWQSMLERAAEKMGEVGLAGYLEGRRARAELLGLHPDSEAALEARRGILSSSVSGLQHFARRVGGPIPNLIDDLARVGAPTLILVGEHDQHFARASEVMAAKMPRAERVVLAGAGHVLNLDQPERFAEAVEGWLERLDAGTRGG